MSRARRIHSYDGTGIRPLYTLCGQALGRPAGIADGEVDMWQGRVLRAVAGGDQTPVTCVLCRRIMREQARLARRL